jgi:transporter family protein
MEPSPVDRRMTGHVKERPHPVPSFPGDRPSHPAVLGDPGIDPVLAARPSTCSPELNLQRHLNMWWIFALLSAFFAALTTIFGKIGVKGIDSDLATAIRTVVILVIAWGIVFATGAARGISSVGGRPLLFLILSGITTGLSWLCYFRALQDGAASMVAPIDKSSLAMTLILAAIFLGEPLTWKTIAGGALIIAGTFVLIL